MSKDERVRYAQLLREKHRRRSRDSLLDYVTWTFPAYRVGRHHLQIANALEKIEAGEIDRLMIFAPPRHGKSLLASIRFPAWYLGRNPTREVIAAAYGGELVAGFGSRLRNLMGSEEHREVFGDKASLAEDVRARDRWLTKSGGVYRAAGVGAGITGFGAHLLLIDDPVKSREDADSETMRAKVWDWYQNDAYTRLMKGGAIVVIMTRWHEDDLGGRLLEHDEDEWTKIHLPALNDRGEALWPDEYPVEALERTRHQVGPRAWQALYQGSPTPDDGTFFQAEWFKESPARFTPRDAQRGIIRTYGASDYAVSSNEGDFTVHVVAGIDANDDLHILDLWRKQATPDVWTDSLINLAERWKPIMWAEEQGAIQKAAEPFIAKRQAERKAYFARMQIPSTKDKPTRAQAIQGRMATGKVYWPTKAPWYPEVLDEMLKFPAGKHDDVVDTIALLGRMLAGMAHGKNITRVDKPGIFPIMLTGDQKQAPPGMRAVTWGEVIEESRKQKRRKRAHGR